MAMLTSPLPMDLRGARSTRRNAPIKRLVTTRPGPPRRRRAPAAPRARLMALRRARWVTNSIYEASESRAGTIGIQEGRVLCPWASE